jgi:hypothetical protein
VLEDHDGQGPAIARIDKATGETAGVVVLNGDRTPEHVIDPASDLLVLESDRSLTGYRWE